MLEAAKRAIEASAESAFFVLARAKELEKAGRDIVHLEIGEPDFVTPLHIREAAVEALRKGETHYTPTPGLPELREAIAGKTKEDLGIDLSWKDNVLVTIGAKEGIFAALASILEPGDEVIMPDPGYPAYEGATKFLDGRPVPVKLREENKFGMIPEDVTRHITDRTKAIVLNSPQNPTGSVLTRENVRGIAEIAKERGIFVVSDEVYKYIIYDGMKHYSPAHFDSELSRTIVLDGFSKGFAMTGWRLGYMIVPRHLSAHTVKILNLMTSCTSAFIQRGGIAALQGPMEPVHEMVRTYQNRRDILVEEVSKIKRISMVKPLGAIYGFVNVKELLNKAGIDSQQLAEWLLEKYGVATLHGTALGQNGEGYVRICYSNSIENIRKGITTIGNAIDELYRR